MTRAWLKIISPNNMAASLLVAVFLCACFDKTQAQSSGDTSATMIAARAFAMIDRNPDEALKLFQRAVALDPYDVNLKRQLGYLYVSKQKNQDALEQFRAAENLKSSDTVKLQIAYVLVSLGQRSDANGIFNDLRLSADPEIREKALQELSAPSVLSTPRWWTHVYAVSYYDTRWSSWFNDAFVQRGLYLSNDELLSAYGTLSLSGDLRSSGGTAPQIFSDNTLMGALGFRLNPFYGFLFDIQWGIAYDLLDKNLDSRVHGDFRAVATYSNGLYAPFTLHEELRAPFYPFADVYASAGNYSRYETNIGYMQLRGGIRVLEVMHTLVDLYTRVNVVRDSRGIMSLDLSSSVVPAQEKKFYNNLVEGGFGARLTPHTEWGLYFAVEYLRGSYWGIPDEEIPATYERWYNSLRSFIIFERTF